MNEKKDEIGFFSEAISFGQWLTKKDNYLASNFYEANGITIKWEKILQAQTLAMVRGDLKYNARSPDQ